MKKVCMHIYKLSILYIYVHIYIYIYVYNIMVKKLAYFLRKYYFSKNIICFENMIYRSKT